MKKILKKNIPVSLQKVLLYVRAYNRAIFSTDKELFLKGYEEKCYKKIAICIGFIPWKQEYMKEYLNRYHLFFTDHYTPSWKLIQLIESLKQDYDVFVWSFKETEKLSRYFLKNNKNITRVEDGFIRSIGLGLHKTKPLSLTFDSRGIYFDSSTESDLNYILKTNAIHYTDEQLEESKKLINTITTKGISKYNFPKKDENIEYKIENKKVVLVVGQVEDDMSIKYGCSRSITNLDLIQNVREENKDVFIIYKPHPDTLTGIRKAKSTMQQWKEYVNEVDTTHRLDSLIKYSEHIYTITSLSGFEALMYGKKVTCFGSPFYSGWGLTDDRDIRDEKVT
ncbi:MAG: hypothetical protein U9N59_10590, partial [Campylobacterota bacterium]|nr:hypothetical protein [Campylobacterota bacterium]